MEKPSMAPSAPLPEHVMPQQMPSAPPTYAQAVGLQPHLPYPVQPVMPMPLPAQSPMPLPVHGPMHIPAQAPLPGQPMNYMGPVVMPAQQHPQQINPHVAATTTTTTVFVGHVPVGPKPVKMKCPMCHADIKTSTVTKDQCSAHLCCLLLFIFGCCLCSCIPYCMDSFKIVQHSCPNCKAYLGTYKP